MIKIFFINNIGIVIIALFLFLNLILTQKIYNSKYLYVFIVFSIILPYLISLILSNENHSFKLTFIICLLPFVYLILLVLIKKYYNKINIFLVSNKMVKPVFLNKDFTYVTWDGDLFGSSDMWDSKIALSPSWFDKFLTLIIIILPIIIIIPFYKD